MLACACSLCGNDYFLDFFSLLAIVVPAFVALQVRSLLKLNLYMSSLLFLKVTPSQLYAYSCPFFVHYLCYSYGFKGALGQWRFSMLSFSASPMVTRFLRGALHFGASSGVIAVYRKRRSFGDLGSRLILMILDRRHCYALWILRDAWSAGFRGIFSDT